MVGSVAEALRARLAFRRDKSWTLEEERKSHLENIYELLEQFREVYAMFYVDALHTVATGTAGTRDQFKTPVPWARLRMLIHLYLPELKSYLADIEQTGPNLGSAVADAILQSSANVAKNKQLVDTLNKAFEDLTKTVDSMRDQIVLLSRAGAERKDASAGRKRIKR